LVNGKRVDIPSFQISVNDVVEVCEKSRKLNRISEALASAGRRSLPQYIEIDKEKGRGVLKALPSRNITFAGLCNQGHLQGSITLKSSDMMIRI